MAIRTNGQKGAPGATDISRLQIVVFDVCNVNLGVDTEQVLQILPLDDATAKEINLIKIEDQISFGQPEIAYHSPHVLVLKDDMSTGILANAPKNIIEIDCDLIRPLPRLTQTRSHIALIWSVYWVGDEAIYLLDSHGILTTTREIV